MKTLKYSSLLILLVLIFSGNSFAQGFGEPFYPETANGAKYIHSIRTQNFMAESR